MAHAGVPVTMMDCDPNRSLTWWSTQSALPDRMRILSEVTEASIVKAVKVHDRQGRLVVMDMEGVASRLVSRAISQADLVITPMRATTLDATVGGRALQLVAEEEEALGRTIVHSVIFTMTRTIPDQAAHRHRGITRSAGGRHHPPPTARTGCLFGSVPVRRQSPDHASPGQYGSGHRQCVAVRSGRLPPSHRRHEMNDHESFAVDLARLRPREKDQSAGAIAQADEAGDRHGFHSREPRRRGRS